MLYNLLIYWNIFPRPDPDVYGPTPQIAKNLTKLICVFRPDPNIYSYRRESTGSCRAALTD